MWQGKALHQCSCRWQPARLIQCSAVKAVFVQQLWSCYLAVARQLLAQCFLFLVLTALSMKDARNTVSAGAFAEPAAVNTGLDAAMFNSGKYWI